MESVWKSVAARGFAAAQEILTAKGRAYRRRSSLFLAGALSGLLVVLPAQSFSSVERPRDDHWVGTWAASPQIQMPGTAAANSTP